MAFPSFVRSSFLLFLTGTVLWLPGISAAHAAASSPNLVKTANYNAATLPVGVEARFDFDGDGKLDVVLADRISRNIVIRRGNGAGAFATAHFTQSVGNTDPESIAVGFLGGASDTKPDLVVMTNGRVRFYTNTSTAGAISFTAPSDTFVNGFTLHNAIITDVNGDGIADIVASGERTSDNAGRVVVFKNTAGGFFSPEASIQVLTTIGPAGRLAAGDLNGDGDPDLVVIDQINNGFVNFMSDGGGAYVDAGNVKQIVGNLPHSIAIAQVTGSDTPEVVVLTTEAAPGDPSQDRDTVWVFGLGQSNTFPFVYAVSPTDSVHTPLGGFSGSVAVADLNADGQNDLVFTNQAAGQIEVFAIALGNDGMIDDFESQLFGAASGAMPLHLSVANVNADLATQNRPKLDVVTVNNNSQGSLNILLAGGAGGSGTATLGVPTLKVTKPGTGSQWTFTATYAAGIPADAAPKLQYTTNKDDAGSWDDVPGVTLAANSSRKVFTAKTGDLPLGTLYFRVIATSGATTTNSTPAAQPFTIAAKVDESVVEVTSLLPIKLGGAKGSNIYFDGTNISLTEKVVKKDQATIAVFAYVGTNRGDITDPIRFSGQAQNTDGFLVQYLSDTQLDITAQVVAGTYVSQPVPRNQSARIFAAIRVPATAADDLLRTLDVSAFSVKNPAFSDRARATVKVNKPADTFFVTNTNGSGDGSLAKAILDVIGNSRKKSTIKFEILPTGQSNLVSIPVTSALAPLVLAKSTLIDGNSQTLFLAALRRSLTITGPNVELRGQGSGTGLSIRTSGAIVQGLKFANFNVGLEVTTENPLGGAKLPAFGNFVIGCVFEGNADSGVLLTAGTSGNYIGFNKAGQDNSFVSFSANGAGTVIGDYGLRLNNADSNRIQNNHFGYLGSENQGTPEAATARGFNKAAVLIASGSSANYFGSKSSLGANFIAGNTGNGGAGQPAFGVALTDAGTGANFIRSNTFGRTAGGVMRKNKGDNVFINNGPNDTIVGGSAVGEGNTILNSDGVGVAILSSNSAGGDGSVIVTTRNRVEGNTIGGTGINEGNRTGGVLVGDPGTQGNTVGGILAAKTNVIVGNGFGNALGSGVSFLATTENFLYGNRIGVDKDGNAKGNLVGVRVVSATNNFIGRETPNGRGNIIAGNQGAGILFSDAFGNVVNASFIGVLEDGVTVRANGTGVELRDGSKFNSIGTGVARTSNVIRGNTGDGVLVDATSTRNPILANLIAANGGLPIDLGDNGLTVNDAGDADGGANNQQNFPVLFTAVHRSGKTTITGAFTSTFSNAAGEPAKFSLNFYSNGDHLGGQIVYTDTQGRVKLTKTGDGTGTFAITVPGNLTGKSITATATAFVYGGADAGLFNGPADTSEYSNSVVGN